MDTGMTALAIIIKALAGVLAGILMGNGAVYLFNHMPAKWFTDYGEKPCEELLNTDGQRVKSYPWKYVFSMFFAAAAVYGFCRDWRYGIAELCIFWLLLEIAIGDKKYRIISDELVILLAVSSIGMIPYVNGWNDMLLGACTGFFIMGAGALIGRMAYKKPAVGGGDIKLFAAVGLAGGVYGMLSIFILTALLSAGHLVIRIARKTVKKGDAVPMAPYVFLSAVIYFLFLHDHIGIWVSTWM